MAEDNTKIKKIDPTLLELVTGILLCGVAVEAAGIFFVERKLYYTLGWWAGILLAVFMAWHLWYSLNRGLDLGEDGAPKYLAGRSIIRYTVVAAGYIAIAVTDIGNPVAAFFGILTLKAAAYLQPFVHKCFKKIFHLE